MNGRLNVTVESDGRIQIDSFVEWTQEDDLAWTDKTDTAHVKYSKRWCRSSYDTAPIVYVHYSTLPGDIRAGILDHGALCEPRRLLESGEVIVPLRLRGAQVEAYALKRPDELTSQFDYIAEQMALSPEKRAHLQFADSLILDMRERLQVPLNKVIKAEVSCGSTLPLSMLARKPGRRHYILQIAITAEGSLKEFKRICLVDQLSAMVLFRPSTAGATQELQHALQSEWTRM